MQAPTGPNRPTIDSDSESWWARPFCPHCWSEDVRLTPATGRSRLYTWSVIHQNVAPFDTVPYVVAMVDLDEGPRLMTEIVDCPAERLNAGMELEIGFREDDDGFVIPVFRPATESTERKRN